MLCNHLIVESKNELNHMSGNKITLNIHFRNFNADLVLESSVIFKEFLVMCLIVTPVDFLGLFCFSLTKQGVVDLICAKLDPLVLSLNPRLMAVLASLFTISCHGWFVWKHAMLRNIVTDLRRVFLLKVIWFRYANDLPIILFFHVIDFPLTKILSAY